MSKQCSAQRNKCFFSLSVRPVDSRNQECQVRDQDKGLLDLMISVSWQW